MYRNFKLSEEEKKQIMEMHKNHGYKKPLNEIERYTPSIDSPEDEIELSKEYGLDEPYDVYKDDPFKSIDSDDFYDETVVGLKSKESPKRKYVDTSVNYTGPKPEGEERPKSKSTTDVKYELDLKIDRYYDFIQGHINTIDKLRSKLSKRGDRMPSWEVNYDKNQIKELNDKIEKYSLIIKKLKNKKSELNP